MLPTLLKIGEWQSQGKNEWDRFLEKPKVEYTDKKGNEITNYVLPVIFDLDKMEVVIDKRNLIEYKEDMAEELKALKIQGGNNKAIYAAVPSSKIIQLYKTFYGKENEQTIEGELFEAINRDAPEIFTKNFQTILGKIFTLKDKAVEKLSYYNENKGIVEIDFKAIEQTFELQKNERVVLVYAMLKAANFGIDNPIPFAQKKEYQDFLEKKYLKKNETVEQEDFDSKKLLCYASGQSAQNVKELNLKERYSLNKMFVTETKNYASLFSDKNFKSNYQVGESNQEKLDYASKFLLNKYKVRIANIDHVIVPQFRVIEKIDWELALTGIKKKSDLIFNFDSLENMAKDLEEETENIYWINFIAFESDGNFFKSTEIIKDVSKFHFQNVINAFRDVHWNFKEEQFVDWNSVMTEFGTTGRLFNFNSVYNLIPLRKDKEKKNKVLDLFKTILENRRIEKSILFDYFSELILCYYFERYNSYTNIPKSSKDYFGKSVRDSIFKYTAFFQVLKNLKLIDMEEVNTTQQEESANKYDKAIQDFFTKMQLNQEQQAMFYLGRMLNAVEWIQIQKKIKKTVINLVNFNGMDRDDIERLRNDLINKARQHSQMGKVIFTNRRFGDLFDYNNWKMQPTESLFFLLTGYSFGSSNKEEEVRQVVEAEEEIN